MATKRPADAVAVIPEVKRTRQDVALCNNRDKQLLEAGIQRTSNLMAPIMALDGHQGEIFTCAFNPEGELLVSSGFDRQICKWCYSYLSQDPD